MNKCPKCGLERVGDHIFACASWCDNGECVQSAPCRIRQLERELAEAREIAQKYEDRYFAANQRIRELTEWRPIDDDTPMDANLQLGWMEEWPEKRWRQEIEWAGHNNDMPPGVSNGWRHGQATHWLPLTPAPTNQ